MPLTPLIRDILTGAAGALTLGELRRLILSAGVMVDSQELASAVVKLFVASKVTREQVNTKSTGRRRVWAYTWSAK